VTAVVGRAVGPAVLALLATTAMAQQASLRGHIKLQEQYLAAAADSVAAALGYRDAEATNLDLRLIGSRTVGSFAFEADYLLQASRGRAVALQKGTEVLEPQFFADRDATQWLSLDHTVTDKDNSDVVESLDRFSMSYTSDRWVFKAGRQAYSWANGIVFRPLDLFDPFAPDAVDESYKPGIDALYTQRLFADGSDVAALIVPRRDPVTGRIDNAESSAALKWHRFATTLQMDLLAARDYGDTVLGLGLSGAWGRAVWRLSLVPVWLDAGGTKTSLVANVEHAWQSRGRNLSGFVEYFRNGFGRADGGYASDELDGDLIARLARGQVFDTGRDYAAGGLRIQWTPLLEVDPVLLVNLNDHSALLLLQGSYSLAENLAIDFGARFAAGPTATEFGGLPTTAGGAVFDAPGSRIYARLARYF
jgi:hypothetical protein